MLMTTYFIGAVAFGLATVPFGWVTPTAYDLLCLAGVGFANIVAQFCVIRSLKLASASVVVPYQYTLIVWSVVFGWLMFAELPDAYTIVGAAIIVAAGLYIFWREQVTAREAGRAGADRVTAQVDRTCHAGRHRADARSACFCSRFNDAVGKWLVATYSVGADAADPQRHDAGPARAVHLARRARGLHRRAAARPAGAARRALDARSRDVLLGGGYLPLADAVTFYLAGPIYVTALSALLLKRAGRLAALERGAGRFRRRDHRAAALRRDADLAGADRAHRQRLLRAADDRRRACCATPPTPC